MTSVISHESKAHVITSDEEAIAIAKELSKEFAQESAERDRAFCVSVKFHRLSHLWLG